MAPFYLLPVGHPRINQHVAWLKRITEKTDGSMNIPVYKHFIKRDTIVSFAEPLFCLQHCPELINRYASNTFLKFEKNAGEGSFHTNLGWQSEKNIKWLYKVHNAFPLLPFFLNDKEQWFVSCMGDYITNFKIPFRPLEGNVLRLYMTEEIISEMGTRLYAFACFFYAFCLGTGFDPMEIIQATFSQHGMSVKAESIVWQVEQNIANGNPYGLMFNHN